MKWLFSFVLVLCFAFLGLFGTSCFYGYTYPIKFSEEIAAACQRFDVEEKTVYSVINIESHFNKNATSNKGAVGLMQVLPSTASEIATKLSLEDFDLYDPADNILIGTCYLSQLISKFGSLETALCAYNAGPANVSTWLSDVAKSSDGKTLDTIPFAETKNYIKKYKKNEKYYSYRLKN
jgi:soluble lytic murein transglycosylase